MKTKFPTKQDKAQISAVIQDAARKLAPELYEYRLSSHTGETLKEATGETVDDVAAQWGMMIDRSFPTGGNAAVLTADGKQSFLVTWRRAGQTINQELLAALQAVREKSIHLVHYLSDPIYADLVPSTTAGLKDRLAAVDRIQSR